jgi:hypothetical protein
MMLYSQNSRLTTDHPGDSLLPFLHLALPVMDEPDLLPRLLNCLGRQTYRRFKLYVCVNQPDHWWNDLSKVSACRNNLESIRLLKEFTGYEIEVIDRSSHGAGWTVKRHGVGYARKTVMDRIDAVAVDRDVIVSLDADTSFSDNFLRSVARAFSRNPEAAALALPYFHNLTTAQDADRAILRYEIYMRHYFLNLARIGSPYAFTALGSAMALPAWSYRAIGGMTPKLSGEDFYFLQKLRKFGQVMLWNGEMVYPEARFSDRVFFGTGPAMIKGAAGDWSSYPVYPGRFFDEIMEIYNLVPMLYAETVDHKVVRFISGVFREDDPFRPIRENQRSLSGFTRAFHEKFDGLRILQYLKAAKETDDTTDEANLWKFLNRFYTKEEIGQLDIDQDGFSLAGSPVAALEKVRMFLFRKEMDVRINSAHG